ncbi:MYND-type domain-containing protein [Mycena kentingensis (nom. inval.)]|nr:MYND-type domain-containing protein [Mycena kentingensis (nom. inval.)]
MVHQFLSPESLGTLDAQTRALVDAACADDAKPSALGPIIHIFENDAAYARRFALLPAIYSILNPARIPRAIESGTTRSVVERSWKLLYAMGHNTSPVLSFIPDDTATLQLWERIWPWIDLIQREQAKLPFLSPYPSEAQRLICEVLMTIVAALAYEQDPGFMEKFALHPPRPGLVRLVAMSWQHTHALAPLERADATRLAVIKFLDHPAIAKPYRADILAGCGGTNADVARAIMLHYRFALYDLQHCAEKPERECNAAASLFASLIFVIGYFDDSKPTVGRMTSDFVDALCDNGFVAVLSQGLRAFDERNHNQKQRMKWCHFVGDVFMRFMAIFMKRAGHLELATAIENGFMQSLVRYSHGEYKSKTEAPVGAIFRSILPGYLIRPAVLVALDGASKHAVHGTALRDAVDAPAFRRSPLLAEYQAIWPILDYRLELLRRLKAGEIPTRRMCDNLQCDRVGEGDSFKRCSGCHKLWYCSAACQNEDWTEGGHKRGCKAFRDLYSHEQSLDLDKLDRTFLRALVDHDAAHYQLNTIQKCAQALRAFPNESDSTPYHTRFNYADGSMSIDCKPVSRVPQAMIPQIAGSSAAWAECLRRAMSPANDGKLVLDVVAFLGGGTVSQCVMPVRIRERKMQRVLEHMRTPAMRGMGLDEFVADAVGFYNEMWKGEGEKERDFHLEISPLKD